jgi:hypothetical protein
MEVGTFKDIYKKYKGKTLVMRFGLLGAAIV